MDRLKRIKYMEELFDIARATADKLEKGQIFSDDLMYLEKIAAELDDYCKSGKWLEDYDADTQGEIPQDLKRGGLSQDALYNFLCDYDILIKQYKDKESDSMKKLLFIDSCIRDENSRTKRIAEPVVEKLKTRYEVETITLNELDLPVIQKEENIRRSNGVIGQDAMNWACKIRDADRIVIAAPFWDMSIPAALKTFFELCSLLDVTFKTNDVTCYGNCKCEDMLFITTRGMNIKTGDPLEQATSYLKALSWLWGIKGLKVIARENFDYISAEKIEEEIASAIEEGLKIAETF